MTLIKQLIVNKDMELKWNFVLVVLSFNVIELSFGNDVNKLIVVMLDGFRHDYLSRDENNHPGFQCIKSDGVVADYVEPIFPSSSFESWTSIATGIPKTILLKIAIILNFAI